MNHVPAALPLLKLIRIQSASVFNAVASVFVLISMAFIFGVVLLREYTKMYMSRPLEVTAKIAS